MLIINSQYLCWISLILFACTIYAYLVNARRAADDPKKRDIPLGAVLLVPVAWPLLLFGAISLLILRALVYGVFLVLFTAALLVIRKPFILNWLKDNAVWIGDRLLAANTWLMKMAFGDWAKKTI